MAFYDLNKKERDDVVTQMGDDIVDDLNTNGAHRILHMFADEDTYIRKSAYLSIGRLYVRDASFAPRILQTLDQFIQHEDFKVRQTTINAAGEIGKKDFGTVSHFFEIGLKDKHHAVCNAVIGSVKKMGEVNPSPVLDWARGYLHDPDPEIRREICHGIELRGRKYPADILPMLRELEWDKVARVRNTLVHVLGQIAYKKGCLQIVLSDLQSWENRSLVEKAWVEILDVHERYKNFATLTVDEAARQIDLYRKNQDTAAP